MKIGDIVFYRMLDEESKINNHQGIAPAIVLAVFPNEYQKVISEGIRTTSAEHNTGLNLKIFTDCGKDIKKTSVEHGLAKGNWCYEVELSDKELMCL